MFYRERITSSYSKSVAPLARIVNRKTAESKAIFVSLHEEDSTVVRSCGTKFWRGLNFAWEIDDALSSILLGIAIFLISLERLIPFRKLIKGSSGISSRDSVDITWRIDTISCLNASVIRRILKHPWHARAPEKC